MLPKVLVSLLTSVQSKLFDMLTLLHDIKAPMIFDPKAGRPSVTTTFAYWFFLATLASLWSLHQHDNQLTATITTAMCWAIATILYMFRSLDKAKIDLDNKSIELDSSEPSVQASDTPQRDVAEPQSNGSAQ